MGVDTATAKVTAGSAVGSPSKCCYCRFVRDDAKADTACEIWNTVLFESENFVVVPTLGAFVEGWLLIIGREHHLCVGSMAQYLHGELEGVVAKVIALVGNVYGPPTIFEHGPSRNGQSMGCGVDHVHLHVVPLPFSLLRAIRESPEFRGLCWTCASRGFSDLSELHEAGRSYVFVKEPDVHGTYCTPVSLPCQSVRRAMAREMGMGQEYDYHKHPFAANVQRTVNRLAGCF